MTSNGQPCGMIHPRVNKIIENKVPQDTEKMGPSYPNYRKLFELFE